MIKRSTANILMGTALALQAGCSTLEPAGEEPRPLNSKDTADLSCGDEPICRKLTPDEIEAAHSIFGESINYDSVRFIHRPHALMKLFTDAIAPNGHVYIYAPDAWAEDYTKSTKRHRRGYMHEMTHIWQHQQGVNLFAKGLASTLANIFNFEKAYHYSFDNDRAFEDYEIEQQAQIIQDYSDNRMKLVEDPKNKAPLCPITALYENVLVKTFPQIKPLCFPDIN